MTSKYAAAHESPNGPGDARPTAQTIIDDQHLRDKLTGKAILITGCSSGIGVETARALHTTGATLYLTVRDTAKAKKNLGDLAASPRVHLLHLDLNSLDSVRACAADLQSRTTALHILIANAGVMACPEGRTADGLEVQFGSNYVAHFLLFQLLKPLLLASSTPAFHSRVVMVSSVGHRFSNVHLDNLNLEGGEYEPWKAYGQSKTAVVWMANEIERRYGGRGLHALSLHPGGIQTDLARHMSEDQVAEWTADREFMLHFKSPAQGAATTVVAAVAAELEGQGGLYLDNCQVVTDEHDPASGRWGPGYASWAFDVEGQKKLWEKTLDILQLQDE
ncbi:hypothetical protein ASPACDRAFT_1889726 [Aspergillus aculeatus ATCC 16872]|uniref:Short-chain dehydrogenase n=1 Tax=Aspergillus aculeatus (strain ATCC 16872 / CBS 172.66 / WB 5094) TaxID=690307 RepID=A0A1L9WNN6_ASPA1|nr:uncharacterized protein ASPACDRAFT_1889726 [Aspergillus aculeatus ATCC 16872]OJJ97792.1 hypothetical protein ASPACDRAFT_1889726 [Aspergillus aculeatus ATCC 16872]